MAHLTCVGHRREEIGEIVAAYRQAGIENILALGAISRTIRPKRRSATTPSPPSCSTTWATAPAPGDQPLSIGVAAHPEVHPRSPDRETDRRMLAAKLRRADFAITQFFFDPEHYLRLVDELQALGVDKPVIPGIMPVTNLGQVERMAQLSGAAFPGWLAERLEGVDDADDVRRIGVEAATELCAALLAAGVPGLHFYTLNRSSATREIYANLGLSVAR